MNQKTTESISANPSRDMDLQTFCNWFALCNALKFINTGCELSGKHIDENDLSYRGIVNYIDCVGGDIMACVKTKKSIPLKYCLDCTKIDDVEINDISYEFLDK